MTMANFSRNNVVRVCMSQKGTLMLYLLSNSSGQWIWIYLFVSITRQNESKNCKDNRIILLKIQIVCFDDGTLHFELLSFWKSSNFQKNK
jgi:hypothetical protein